jgi:hypothetical protein
MTGTTLGGPATATEQGILLRLQRQALEYFIDNQEPCGLVLDRQRNRGPRSVHGLCSSAATGMGCISLALASATPHRLISHAEAVRRVRATVQHALERLPCDHGMVPHFIHATTGAVSGSDHFSTIDSSWLIAGAMWAAEFLQDGNLEALARRLYDRVNWKYWTDNHEAGFLRHGKDRHAAFLPCAWDRLNGETVFMFILAAGAEDERALSPDVRHAWQLRYGTIAGHRFNNADLGLFVFQYGLDLLDLERWRGGGADLHGESRLAALANRDFCRELAGQFRTYRRFWGLSAGDGPGDSSDLDIYRCYAPAGPIDGTAHLTATLASIAHCPDSVLENVVNAEMDEGLSAFGRYGLSNVNLDRGWVSQDMVGIDAGAAALALDNYLMEGRVRRVFHRLPCVDLGLRRLGFMPGKPEDGARQSA